jgi:phage-related protein
MNVNLVSQLANGTEVRRKFFPAINHFIVKKIKIHSFLFSVSYGNETILETCQKHERVREVRWNMRPINNSNQAGMQIILWHCGLIDYLF